MAALHRLPVPGRRRSGARAGVPAGLLTVAVALSVVLSLVVPGVPGVPGGPLGAGPAHAGPSTARRCAPTPALLTGAPVGRWRPASGVHVTAWRGRNHLGDRVQLTVVAADLARARLRSVAVARSGTAVPASRLLASVRSAVAGVNGDYFDYDRAGRAVPAGAQIRAGKVQRLPAGATRFVGVGDDGRVRTGRVRVRGSAVLPPSRPSAVRPSLAVTAVNPAHLPSTGVAVVTGYLGRGRPAAAWEIVVRRGAVVFSGRRAPFGAGLRFGAEAAAVRGTAVGRDVLLAARAGPSATALARMRVGARVTVRWSARTQDGVRLLEAVGSGAAVLAGGRVVASCTGAGVWARARTVVAWDAAGRRVWLMAVDTGGMAVPVGRWGLTYHQVAELARRLGATDAALLDGGGSTTVVIRRAGGIARVDATGRVPQRAVPNGLVLVPAR